MTIQEFFLIVMVIIFSVPYLIWRLGKTDYWAPLVVVQICIGILLGPGVSGTIFPEYYKSIFNPQVHQTLNGIAWWSIMIFVWIAGIELDLKKAWLNKRDSCITAGLGLCCPLLLGCLAASVLMTFNTNWIGSKGMVWQFIIGVGMACAVTALPILILLMEKLKILREPIGQRIMRYASLDDIAIWFVLSLVLLDWDRVGLQGIFLVSFIVISFLYRKLMRSIQESDRWYVSFIWLAVCGLASDWAGLHFMVGAFLAGVVMDSDWFNQEDMDKNKAEFPANADNGWIAMLEHYFLTAWLPTQQTPREYYAKRLSHNQYTAGIITPVGTIESGQTKQISVPFYAGPQEQEKLAQLSPGLDLTVDYGWLTILAQPLFKLLSFYHSWVDNWGVSIILLTLTVKLLFFPLSAAGYRSMAKLRVVTPKLQKIREQYASDRQRMHQAMMEFYKEEKINPMGGCLPILVQIPVFIALFWTLMSAVELRNTPFALWITDLSTPDPYYVLPLIMGISMWIQSKLSPTPADPIQAKVMQIMPIAFSVFFFFFPSGLVLYSLCNNILSILQQWQITRMYENKAEDASKDKNKKHKKIESAPVVEKLALNPSVPAEERVEEGATTSATITEGQSESISSTEAIAPKPKPKTSSLSNKNKPPQGKKVRKK